MIALLLLLLLQIYALLLVRCQPVLWITSRNSQQDRSTTRYGCDHNKPAGCHPSFSQRQLMIPSSIIESICTNIFELIYTTASMEEKEKTIMAEDTRSSSMAATIIPIVIVVNALPFPANQVEGSDGTTIIGNYQKYLQNKRLYLLEDIPNIYSI